MEFIILTGERVGKFRIPKINLIESNELTILYDKITNNDVRIITNEITKIKKDLPVSISIFGDTLHLKVGEHNYYYNRKTMNKISSEEYCSGSDNVVYVNVKSYELSNVESIYSLDCDNSKILRYLKHNFIPTTKTGTNFEINIELFIINNRILPVNTMLSSYNSIISIQGLLRKRYLPEIINTKQKLRSISDGIISGLRIDNYYYSILGKNKINIIKDTTKHTEVRIGSKVFSRTQINNNVRSTINTYNNKLFELRIRGSINNITSVFKYVPFSTDIGGSNLSLLKLMKLIKMIDNFKTKF